MPRIGTRLLTIVAALSLLLAAPLAQAEEADDGEDSGVSLEVSLGGEGDAQAGGRPTHRPFNLHFAIGGSFALGNELANHDAPLDDKGGQGTIGLDFVMIEPLAFSILGGFNAFTAGADNALRNVFIGAGLRLRLFADDNGAILDEGTIWGNLWIDAHFNYDNYLYEHHGGYNIGLGYEFAIAKNFNLGPYVRFHHVPWGDGLTFKMLSIGIAISLGGMFKPDDQDGDGINDDKDECPTDPEDKDGFEDENGCPDEDNDEDGVLDVDDDCPDLAGVAKLKGCPDYDIDGDGINNDVDQCPEEPEDKDDFEDEDGCPDPDNDGDGVLDGDDQCPTEVEDKDGFEDEDGCPDPDNDNDGVLDGDDKCPLEAETKNGIDDEDGCPDLVRVVGNQIKILQKVYFATNKDTILEKSYPVLEEVAAVIVAKKEIKVRVEGHTDSKGPDKKNMDLSQRRAESVKKFLMDKGVEEERLIAEGKGETMPIADNNRSAGRAENRRVEFHIIAPEPSPAAAAPAEEAAPEEAPAE